MRKIAVLVMVLCTLLGSALAEEWVEVDVCVNEGSIAGVGLHAGVSKTLDEMCIQDFDGDGEVTLSEIDERIKAVFHSEDETINVEQDTGFMQWFEGKRSGFEYPTAHIAQKIPASADGKRIWCDLTDTVTGETRTIQYTLHLGPIIVETPDISPEPIDIGANSWELQVEEGTEVSIVLKDNLREGWNGEWEYSWYKSKFTAEGGWEDEIRFANNGNSLTYTAGLEDNGWTYECHLVTKDEATGEYISHTWQVLMYVFPQGEIKSFKPLNAAGEIAYENGMVLHSVYGEIMEKADLPYSEQRKWRERLIWNSCEGLTFTWYSEDEALQEKLEHQRGAGVGQHLMFELEEEEAKRLIEQGEPFYCIIADESTGEMLAEIRYTIVEP